MVGGALASLEGHDAPFFTWDVNGTIWRAETDKIEVEYAWERRTRLGSEQKPRSDRDHVTLREDDRVLLDFVPVPSAEFPASCYRHVALELGVSIRAEPELADRRIAYDLWLVSEEHGKRVTRRSQLVGRQGEKLLFDYGTLRSKLEGVTLAEGGSHIVETVVRGRIRGRVQSDGTIEVALLAEREVRPSDGGWATGARGEKVVRVAAGETVKLELPPPSSVGERVKDAAATLQAIGQHQIALVLTATPME
jgi:hypothetical protein